MPDAPNRRILAMQPSPSGESRIIPDVEPAYWGPRNPSVQLRMMAAVEGRAKLPGKALCNQLPGFAEVPLVAADGQGRGIRCQNVDEYMSENITIFVSEPVGKWTPK